MDDWELENLLKDLESDRAERKASISDRGKLREAIRAFANDLPNHKPIFYLKPADGAIGAHVRAVQGAYRRIAATTDLSMSKIGLV